MKEQAADEAQSLRYWFRKKYGLPPLDPRFLGMTDFEIAQEYWAAQFDKELDQGREIDPTMFDTDEVDAEIERWAEEDALAGEWEDVKLEP